jgi:hypothetical protein
MTTRLSQSALPAVFARANDAEGDDDNDSHG